MDPSFQIGKLSVSIYITHNTEPEFFYGKTFELHLIEIWNRRIATPIGDIFLFDDDVKGAFRHCKYHPDVTTAFAFIISIFLFIPLRGTFGSIVSPVDFELIARARTHLAEYLSTRRDLLPSIDTS